MLDIVSMNIHKRLNIVLIFSVFNASFKPQYQWESMPNGHWKIDFETNEIFLSDEPNS